MDEKRTFVNSLGIKKRKEKKEKKKLLIKFKGINKTFSIV